MFFNPFTPMRNQERISPYNCQYDINQISDENLLKKNINLGIIG